MNSFAEYCFDTGFCLDSF